MTTARVLTVASALAADDFAGRAVARALLADGVPVAARQIVDETEAALEPALGAALEAGGLAVVLAPAGGSAGDIVRRTLARLAGARLVLNETLHSLLEADYRGRGQALPHRLDRLALLPHGAELWPTPSGEPGWSIAARAGVAAVLPLGSAHLDALVKDRLLPLARGRIGRSEVRVLRTLHVAALGPGDVEERLGAWLGRPGTVSVSVVVVDGDVSVRLLSRGASRASALSALALVESAIREALGADCYGADADSLEAVVGKLLVERRSTVSVAESCTGGLVSQRLASVPGASRYLERGVVSYSNRAKEQMLGVSPSVLAAHGAVSAQAAEAMAAGVRRAAASDWGLAVTGIAGPGGGTADKPVGTVFVAAAGPRGAAGRRFRFSGGRDAVQRGAARSALDVLRRALIDSRAAGVESPGGVSTRERA